MKSKEDSINLYYMNKGQAKNHKADDTIKRKKAKEREKRIKQNKQKNEEQDRFDLETDAVINMTNKNKIKKDEEKRKKIDKEERKRKKRNKKIKFILKTILLLGIIIGGTVFAMTSPMFNIKNIEVINNNEITNETIISLSGLKIDENIFKYRTSDVINNIKENPYVENVKVHRKIPNTIQIDVEERTPRYSVDFMGKYVYINTQGYFLEISEDSKGLPIIQGVSTPEEQIVPNNRLCNEDLEKLEDVIKIMNVAKENNLDTKVTSIDISNKNEYSIYIEEEKKKVYLGDISNLSNKMLYVVAIIEQEKGNEGDIYVNQEINGKLKTYFREKV